MQRLRARIIGEASKVPSKCCLEVEAKRQGLAVTEAAGSTAKVLTMLPRAAEAYRAAIIAGLDELAP